MQVLIAVVCEYGGRVPRERKERRWKFPIPYPFRIASIVSGDFGGFSKCCYLMNV